MSTTDETLVREALQQATDELTAPVVRLTRHATVGGRRLRRRRQAVVIAGTVGVLGAVVVPVLLALAGSGTSAGTPIATDPTPMPTPVQQTESLTPESEPALLGDARWTKMPAADMASLLDHHLLPYGMGLSDAVVTNEDRAPGETERVQKGWLRADLTREGRTVGGINVILMAPGEPRSRYTCPGNLVAPDSCQEITNGAGTTFGRQSVTTTGDVTVVEVVLRGPGDGLVYVAVSNSADDKWGLGSTVASSVSPLTLEQVTDIATSDLWTA